MADHRSSTLSDDYLRITRGLQQDGIPHAQLRGTVSLETEYAGGGTLNPAPPAVSDRLRRLEGADPIARIPVVRAAPGESRIGGFLDGSQRTVSAWRVGVVPVVATVAAAAVLQRDDNGEVRIARDAAGETTLRLEHRWLIPRESNDPHVEAVIARIEDHGGRVDDPLHGRTMKEGVRDREIYDRYLNTYRSMVEAAYIAARSVRTEVELAIADTWSQVDPTGEAWLVLDGRRRLNVPRTLGVVKQVTSQHLIGAEAVQVYDLPAGHRTSAFVPLDSGRGAPVAGGQWRSASATGNASSVRWYMRMHDHTGLDTYHGLIRVEAPADVDTSDEIAEKSSWLLAERTPRATADARWASLLYPIHLLEKMLKREIATETRAWPNASGPGV